jgi:hypothetical protein
VRALKIGYQASRSDNSQYPLANASVYRNPGESTSA